MTTIAETDDAKTPYKISMNNAPANSIGTHKYILKITSTYVPWTEVVVDFSVTVFKNKSTDCVISTFTKTADPAAEDLTYIIWMDPTAFDFTQKWPNNCNYAY